MPSDGPKSGWSLVADRDEAASVLAAIVDLDPDREYSKSDLADETGVPLKTLYLADVLDDLAALGVLERAGADGDESEVAFRVDPDSEVLSVAREFDDAVARSLETAEAN